MSKEIFEKVRLSHEDLEALKNLFCKYFLAEDKLWLFGSRVNLNKKGGGYRFVYRN